MAGLTLTMMLSHAFPFLLPVVKTGVVLLVLFAAGDAVVLFNRRVTVTVARHTGPVMSLGDENPIALTFVNGSALTLSIAVIDELPAQLQQRDFNFRFRLLPFASHTHRYQVRPLVRGEYNFGSTCLFIATRLGLIKRRLASSGEVMVPVYPSIIQMRRYAFKTIAKTALEYGVKKVRRIGHSYEFEHIRPYSHGDDYRSINWKATGRRAQLMVNQYEDEKSQQVYCIIDKSRVMHMPFNGLSLLDYAVNASLVISNIVLGRHDKAGLITFAERPRTLLKANRNKTQLKKVLEALYREEEMPVEANYERMYMAVRKMVRGRSLLFLYTNFESTYALQRVLPQLRKLNTHHLLVVVFFENTEIRTDTAGQVDDLEGVYTQITAENYILSKVQIAQQLRQFGIFSILTKPEHLTVDTINKYLELKSRGMI